jgi:phospholipid-binding lipoprotein MlaA
MSPRSKFQAFGSLSTLIVGLTFGGSLALAESNDDSSVMVALLEQQGQLDQQIGQVEQRILDVQHRPFHSKTPNPLMALLIDGKNNGNVNSQDDEVPMLEEYTVENTYLDPFDENPSEVVPDPWEGFNSTVFDFNLSLDRNFIRPVAQGYHDIMPDVAEEALGDAFSNIRIVPRLTNNLLQGKVSEAGVVVSRFLINSTIGLARFFDVAEAQFGLTAPAEEDAGQTLAKLGMESGPYLGLPFLPPTTVRDGVGTLADFALDPLNYVLPFVAQASKRASETVNTRSQNLDTFEGIEERTLDLYAAVRDAYWQTRAQAIQN